MNKKFRRFALVSLLAPAFIASFMARVACADIPWDSNFDSTTENDTATLNGLMGDREFTPKDTSYNHNPADDIPRLTNLFDTSPAAQTYEDAARCKNVYVNRAPNSPTVSDDDTVDNCPLPSDPEGGSDQDPSRVPSTLPSSTPTVPVSTSGPKGFPTRISTFPRSLQPHAPHKPT